MTTRLRRNSAVVALCFCLFLAAALLSSARNTVTISGKERRAAERSLAARLDDYGDPSANRGHEPQQPKAKSGGGGGGRRIP